MSKDYNLRSKNINQESPDWNKSPPEISFLTDSSAETTEVSSFTQSLTQTQTENPSLLQVSETISPEHTQIQPSPEQSLETTVVSSPTLTNYFDFQPPVRSSLLPTVIIQNISEIPSTSTQGSTDQFYSLDTSNTSDNLKLEDSIEQLPVFDDEHVTQIQANRVNLFNTLQPFAKNSSASSHGTVTPIELLTPEQKIVIAADIISEVIRKVEILNLIHTPHTNDMSENGNNDHVNEDNAENVTVAQSRTEQHAAVLPKFKHPESFNPATSNAIKFLKDYEVTTSNNRWTDSQKMAYFGSFLEGLANTWYIKYFKKDANDNKTWLDIKEDFIKEFASDDPRRDARRTLSRRQQRANENIKNYLYDILELCHDANPDMSPDIIRDHFESGLNDLHREQFLILADQSMSMEELKTLVNKLQKIHQEAVRKETLTQVNNLVTAKTSNNTANRFSNVRVQQNRPWRQSNFQRQRNFLTPPASNYSNNNNPQYQTYYPRQYSTYSNNQPQIQPPRFNRTPNLINRYPMQPMQAGPTNFRPNFHTNYTNNYSRNRGGQQNIFQTRSQAGNIICWKCNKVGHHMRACRQSPPETRASSAPTINNSLDSRAQESQTSVPNQPWRRQ